jgi:hypothetical protein
MAKIKNMLQVAKHGIQSKEENWIGISAAVGLFTNGGDETKKEEFVQFNPYLPGTLIKLTILAVLKFFPKVKIMVPIGESCWTFCLRTRHRLLARHQ